MSKMLPVKIVLIIIGIVLFAWTFFPMFYTGNVHIGGVTGTGLGAALALYGLFFGTVNGFIKWLWKPAAGKCILIAVAAAGAAILGLAIACIISMAGAVTADPAQNSTVVVLGCHVYKSGPSRMLVSRLKTAKEYLDENPESVCIVCGGQGSNEPCTEASAMREYLVAAGIDASRIYLEDTSTDTAENLANAMAIIEENDLNTQTVIVTNEFHVYRARQRALKEGYENPEMLGAPTLWWLFPAMVIREMYGILEMWFL